MNMPVLIVNDMAISYDDHIILENLDFTIEQGDVFVIMGGSGSGKSTLMRALTGLKRPTRGKVIYGDENLWQAEHHTKQQIMERFGVMFQSGALFSSMTLLENVALRLYQQTRYSEARVKKIARLKLSLVGLKGYENYYPSELSGGMQKRAGIARAMAMDPPILFFDEPSAGMDPVSSKLLDQLILELRNSMGTTMIVVTHELDSIFTIASNSIFLDHHKRTITASGNPAELLKSTTLPEIRAFLTRGKNA